MLQSQWKKWIRMDVYITWSGEILYIYMLQFDPRIKTLPIARVTL